MNLTLPEAVEYLLKNDWDLHTTARRLKCLKTWTNKYVSIQFFNCLLYRIYKIFVFLYHMSLIFFLIYNYVMSLINLSESLYITKPFFFFFYNFVLMIRLNLNENKRLFSWNILFFISNSNTHLLSELVPYNHYDLIKKH